MPLNLRQNPFNMRNGRWAQTATNASPAMKIVQGFTQPGSSHMPGVDGVGAVKPTAPRSTVQAQPAPSPLPTPAKVGTFQYGVDPSSWFGGVQPKPLIADPGIGGNNQPPENAPPPYNEGGVPGENGNPNPAPITPPPTQDTPPPTPTGGPDTSKWDTNGYPIPGHTAGNPGQAPAGWDPLKWADPNHQSPKYVVGRILSQYPPTTAGLQQAIAEIAKAYPGAKLVGPGDIDLGFGDGAVDVLIGAASGGSGWTWIDQAGASQGPAPAPAPAPPPVPAPGGGGGGEVPPPVQVGDKKTNPMLNNPGMTEAFAALMKALGMAVPDAAGLKEASKENLLATRQADLDSLQAKAAAQGMGRSGIPIAVDASIRDQFDSNLTGSYRDIDQTVQQQGFENLMGVAQGFQSHGAEQFGQEFSLKELEQNAAQFAQQMGFNYAQLSQQDRQFFQSLALSKWIAEKNQQNRELEILMGGLG